MTVKEYLNQARNMDELIKSNKAELERLRELSTCISSPAAGGTSRGNAPGDRVGNIATRIADLEAQIQQDIDYYITVKSDIHNAIERITNRDERLLLRMRYIDGMTWEQIAEKMHYSVSGIYKLHKKSINRFYSIGQ